MTNINCSSNCIYQKNGKCQFENIVDKKTNYTSNPQNIDCAYYSKPPYSN